MLRKPRQSGTLDYLMGSARSNNDCGIVRPRLRGNQIDSELEFSRLIDREITGFAAFQNAVELDPQLAKNLGLIRPVTPESAFPRGFRKKSDRVNGRSSQFAQPSHLLGLNAHTDRNLRAGLALPPLQDIRRASRSGH
jgi:hypothetical protein